MKKILAFFLLITGVTQAQNLNIPDPVLKAHLLLMADSNNDGELSYWEGQTITELIIIDMGITSLIGIESFMNLEKLICSYNQITTPLNFYNMYSLEILECNNNLIPSIDVTGLTNLKSIYATHNQITSLDVSTVNSLETLAIGNNPLSELSLNTAIKGFSCNNTNITQIDVIGFSDLISISAHSNPMLESVNAAGVTTLTHFSGYGSPSMEWIDVSNTQIPSLNLNGNSSLNSINVENCTLITHLWIPDAQLTSLDVSGLSSLQELKCQNNSITTFDISGCSSLKTAWIQNNQIASLDFSDSPLLETVLTTGNNYPFLDMSNRPLLTTFNTGNNPNLHTLSIENCTGLTHIGCDNSPLLTSFNIQGCVNAANLGVQHTGLTNLNASDLPLLTNVNISYNSQMNSINLTNTTNIEYLQLRQSNFSELDISSLTALIYLDCQNNSLTTLDASQNTALTTLRCNNNALETLFIKNGTDELVQLYGNNNLQYVCVDESQKEEVIQAMTPSQNASVNSYCSIELGGDYNTITGKVMIDLNGNGCDETEGVNSFVKVKITDGNTDSYVFTNSSATYSHYVGIGNYMITAELENIPYFMISPVSDSVEFTDENNNIYTRDFCIQPDGVHSDLEIIIEPVFPARPGFIAIYNIVYRNIGNQVETGYVNFNYNQTVLDLVSTSIIPTLSFPENGDLMWTIPNILPFQSGSIQVVFNVNSPQDNPSVNIGDILTFEAFIDVNTDENWDDNEFILNEEVVGAYDPNDITCIEGDVVSSSLIGEELHYVIRFENTGNFYAENVVVVMEIDSEKYDISSIQLLNSSHNVQARIINNILELFFSQIYLDSGGHGNILLAMKTINSLSEGDVVQSKADIYFDYNYPIITNDAITLFEATMSIDDNPKAIELKFYPNPTTDYFNITSEEMIQSIELYDVSGRLVRTSLVNNFESKQDVTNLSNGTYILKIKTNKGEVSGKIIKN